MDDSEWNYNTILQGYENDAGNFYIEIFLRTKDELEDKLNERKWTTLDKDDAQALIWELQKFINNKAVINPDINPNDN